MRKPFLCNCSEEVTQKLARTTYLPIVNAMEFPVGFLSSIAQSSGFEPETFTQEHSQPAPVSVRLNPLKPTQLFVNQPTVPWCEYGIYLNDRPVFTLDPYFQGGAYYVQEASSMFLAEAFRQTVDLSEQVKVLDLCAAPGGKSTLIAGMISEDSLLVSNEVIKNRAHILADNMVRWGLLNGFVTNNDPRDFQRLPGYFDVMVIDAPCSGSGLFRKDPTAMKEWSLDNVVLCSQRQHRIIADAWDALKEDGILIYSTCSYSEQENEEVLDWLLNTFQAESLPLKLDSTWGITETISKQHKAFGYRFYPNLLKGEGFFLAVFQKKEGQQYPLRPFKPQRTKGFHTEKAILSEWLTDLSELTWTEVNGDYFLLPSGLLDDFLLFQKKVYFRKAGVRIGQFKGKDLIPDHELALSTLLSDEIPQLKLNKEDALLYLKKQDFAIETYQKGWHLITYEGLGLGWGKILPNRFNSHLPKDWRILMEID